QTLYCASTQVADLAPLAGLTALQTLNCTDTQVADLAPLAGLAALQTLHCYRTRVADLAPLAGLTDLQTIDCASTQVADLAPLAGLTALQTIDCASTQVADLAPIAGLTALQTLKCWKTEVADLAPLAGLTALQTLDCRNTQVADLAPLAGLVGLRSLDTSRCHLRALPRDVLALPALTELILQEALVPGIPAELLSQRYDDSCLDALRAHLADLDTGGAEAADARLLLLGNGLAGKTQIARWLRGEGFDPAVPSTHGIQLGGFELPGGGRVQIWDFGGQDIYHGTHALFLRNPAILAPVWARGREPEVVPDYALGDLSFRNHPLAYWAALARHQRHRASPVLFLQAQCDTEAEEAHPFPIPADTLDALPWKRQLHVSAKEHRGKAELLAMLGSAMGWMRDPQRLGTQQVGAGRLRVQRALEARCDAGARWIERSEFDALCDEQGGITSRDHALAWLDASGAVLHRPGLFEGRIILDQGWALKAIYAVFDRGGCYQQVVRNGGRFTRWLLGLTKWQGRTDEEQRLLLGMMRSCGICFLHPPVGERWKDDPLDEYIAPELLPGHAAIAARLAGLWDAEAAQEAAVFRYPFLHDGLIRGVMAAIGEEAGPDA
ncbi:MAG: COR domain-containing protein, partial [Paracraurococcus sp.]